MPRPPIAIGLDMSTTVLEPSSPAAQRASPCAGKPAIDLELSNPAFCGPLALLLELIEKRRLPITEVSLAEVTDQYLERMRSLVGLDPEMLADFLVVAAKLLVIKSRELLPSEPRPPEEPDVAAALQRRLLEYALFRDAAERLRSLEESGHRSYPRQQPPGLSNRAEPPLEPVPPEALRDAMARMLKAIRQDGEPLKLPPVVSVEERIEHLMRHLALRGAATFAELAGATVADVVATFLALLELIRRGAVSAEQQHPFAEIRISLAEAEG